MQSKTKAALCRFGLAVCGASLALASACAGFRVFERYNAGSYSGEARGQLGVIRVLVETNTTSMLDISVVQSAEDEQIGGAAIDELCVRMLDANTSAVDAVSGATCTSEAFIRAVEEALGKAQTRR
jgi:uncharacterized protein with FMN-binding domain